MAVVKYTGMTLRGNNDEMLTGGKRWKETPGAKHGIQVRMFDSYIHV